MKRATVVVTMLAVTLLLGGCAGTPEATMQWYLSEKPGELRVPVSGQYDPGAPPVLTGEEGEGR